MTKTSSISFVFCNPADKTLGYAPEKGKITITVESDAEAAHELLQEIETEESFEKLLQEKFCAESGRVVSSEVASMLENP